MSEKSETQPLPVDKSLLDTDTLSEIYKGVDDTVGLHAAAYIIEFGELSFTSVSVHEVLFGHYLKGTEKRAKRFLEVFSDHNEIAPAPEDFRLAARIRAALQKSGRPIGQLDPLIAACALGRDLPLVTGNVRHYRFVQECGFPIVLLNWREP